MDLQLIELDADAIRTHLSDLRRILVDSVHDGAAIGFMAPLRDDEAEAFWLTTVLPEVEQRRRVMLGALCERRIIGTVQLILSMPPNQRHRCEIAKMIVHPMARRRGIARRLMTKAMERAAESEKSLITLDTRSGDRAEPLYASLGFQVAGIIPGYAWDPDGQARHATTYMFRHLG